MNRMKRNAGFSLVELLTVISIMAVMAAIATGVYFRIRAAQTDAANETIVTRLSTIMTRVTQAVRDDVAYDAKTNNLNPMVLFLSRNSPTTTIVLDEDRDIARSLATYLKMKAEFPQYFDEARSAKAPPNRNLLREGTLLVRPPLQINNVPVSASETVLYPPKPAYVQTASNLVLLRTPAPTGLSAGNEGRDYALEAAALLYTILTERGNRGELMGDDIVGASVGEVITDFRLTTDPVGTRNTTGQKVKVFRDLLGTPITYIRWATNPEIQANPTTGVMNQDPLDPGNRLPAWANPNANNRNALYALTALRYDSYWATVASNANAAAAPIPYQNQRWVTAVIAAGNSKKWDALNDAMDTAIRSNPSLLINVPDSEGYIFSTNTRK